MHMAMVIYIYIYIYICGNVYYIYIYTLPHIIHTIFFSFTLLPSVPTQGLVPRGTLGEGDQPRQGPDSQAAAWGREEAVATSGRGIQPRLKGCRRLLGGGDT